MLLLALALAVLPTHAHADGLSDADQESQNSSAEIQDFLNYDQDSMHYLAQAGVIFPHEIDGADSEASGRPPMIFDFGVYLPRGEARKWIGGLTLAISSDDLSRASGPQFSLEQIVLGLSGVYFSSGRIGDGWYLRADAGPALVSWTEAWNADSGSRFGVGARIAAGYACDLFGNGPRILFEADTDYRWAPPAQIGQLSTYDAGVGVGVLF